jgi:hypothetical protein
MFADCGWEYLQDAFGYSYFRKPASEMVGEESIFCDDASRLEMMKRVFKGRVWPLVILYPMLLINFFNGFWIYRAPVLTFSIGALVVLYTVIFIRFAVQYYKYTKDKTV